MEEGRAGGARRDVAAAAGEVGAAPVAAGPTSPGPEAAAGLDPQHLQQRSLPVPRSSRGPRLRPGGAQATATVAAVQPSQQLPASPSAAAPAAGDCNTAAQSSRQGQPVQQKPEYHDGEAGASSQQEEEHSEGGQAKEKLRKQCSHCGSTTTTGGQWRRHSTTHALLCFACGHYERRTGGLPSRHVLQRGEQQRHAQPVAQRQCLHCGSRSPGPVSEAHPNWRRHPATGEEWLCRSCYYKALKQVKRQRRQPPAGGGPSGSSSDGEEVAEEEEQGLAASRPSPHSRQRQHAAVGAAAEPGATNPVAGPAAAAGQHAAARRPCYQ